MTPFEQACKQLADYRALPLALVKKEIAPDVWLRYEPDRPAVLIQEQQIGTDAALAIADALRHHLTEPAPSPRPASFVESALFENAVWHLGGNACVGTRSATRNPECIACQCLTALDAAPKPAASAAVAELVAAAELGKDTLARVNAGYWTGEQLTKVITELSRAVRDVKSEIAASEMGDVVAVRAVTSDVAPEMANPAAEILP